MSLEVFQILNNEPFDNSFIKRVLSKVYHQQGAHLNRSGQNIEISFGENNKYHQIGKADLGIDFTVRKNDTTNFHHDDPIRLVNIAFSFGLVLKKLLCLHQSVQIQNITNFAAKYLLLGKRCDIKMVIYYLNSIILTKMILRFLIECSIY